MAACHYPIVLAAAVGLGQNGNGNGDYYAAVNAATRELHHQLGYFQRALATIPGPPMGRGLYKQSHLLIAHVIYLQQVVERNAPREELVLAYSKVENKLRTMLWDVQDLEQWSSALRTFSQGVASANDDLQFALAGGERPPTHEIPLSGHEMPRTPPPNSVVPSHEPPPAPHSNRLYERLPKHESPPTGAPRANHEARDPYHQTLVLKEKVNTLLNRVRWVFHMQRELPQWNADFKELYWQIAELQRMQKSIASADDLKAQFDKADRAWEKLVTRFKNETEDIQLLLRYRFGQADQAFARLATAFGITNRRPALRTDFTETPRPIQTRR